jgi:hypothetical protein
LNHDVIDTHLVFGDPALRIAGIANDGPAFRVYLPVVMSGE